MCHRYLLAIGALAAAAAVALGAYGAHGLEDRLVTLGYAAELPQRMAWFETGVKYQLYHALGLLIVTLLTLQPSPIRVSRWVSIAFLLGMVLFCGSLYAMTFLSTDWKKLGAVVPLGGLAFILGWIALAYDSCRGDAT